MYIAYENPKELTRVRREVLPEPLGPRSRIEGNVVSPLARKKTVCRNIGIVNTSRSAIMSPTGDGLMTACAQSWIVDISAACDVMCRKVLEVERCKAPFGTEEADDAQPRWTTQITCLARKWNLTNINCTNLSVVILPLLFLPSF